MTSEIGHGTRDRRGRYGPRALGVTLPKVTRRALGRRGFAEGGLLAEWPGIVGAELAAVCLPSKLRFPRAGRRAEGTLTLRVAPGHATTLQHLEPLLLERLNGYFGYRAVARLRLRQGPLTPPPAPQRARPVALTARQEAALKSRTAAIDDPSLRAALEGLGRALGRSAGPSSTK